MAARSTASERLKICLIGPKLSGKSALLATMWDSVRLGSYGYGVERPFSLDPIGEDGAVGFGTKYKELRDRFYDPEWTSTDTHDVFDFEFFLRFGISGPSGPPVAVHFDVTDSAGELAVPRGDGNAAEINPQVQKKLFDRFYAAEAVILTVPLLRIGKEEWVDTMADLISGLTNREQIPTKRVVVAFSQYERLFVKLGPCAWQFASDPLVAAHVIRETLQATTWLNSKLQLLAATHRVDIRFIVTSAYGFTRDFGNPNIDPFADGESRFRMPNQTSNRKALNEFWRPFLTADPFIYAASGIDSAFTFSYEQLMGRRQPPRQTVDANRGRKRKSLFDSFVDFFDVNSRTR